MTAPNIEKLRALHAEKEGALFLLSGPNELPVSVREAARQKVRQWNAALNDAAPSLFDRVAQLEAFRDFALRHTSPSRAADRTLEETYSMLAHHPAAKDAPTEWRDQPNPETSLCDQ